MPNRTVSNDVSHANFDANSPGGLFKNPLRNLFPDYARMFADLHPHLETAVTDLQWHQRILRVPAGWAGILTPLVLVSAYDLWDTWQSGSYLFWIQAAFVLWGVSAAIGFITRYFRSISRKQAINAWIRGIPETDRHRISRALNDFSSATILVAIEHSYFNTYLSPLNVEKLKGSLRRHASALVNNPAPDLVLEALCFSFGVGSNSLEGLMENIRRDVITVGLNHASMTHKFEAIGAAYLKSGELP